MRAQAIQRGSEVQQAASAAQRTKSRAHPRLPPAHHPPNTDRHILLRFSSNDVVERPLLERPVEHILHAIPSREAPLRGEVPFYASIEPPSSQHRLSRKSAAHLTEPKSALGVPLNGTLAAEKPEKRSWRPSNGTPAAPKCTPDSVRALRDSQRGSETRAIF